MGDIAKLAGLTQLTIGRGIHEHPVFSPDGKHVAYYGGTYGSLQIFLVGADGSGQRPLTSARGNHTQPAFSPDGRHVYFRHQSANDAPWSLVRVLLDDPVDRTVLIADAKVSFKHPSPSPDGKTLAWFSDAGTPGNFHLFSAPLSRTGLGTPVRLTDDRKRNDCHPTWSPDARSLVFHAYIGVTDASESHIFTCDRDGGSVRRLTREPGYHKHPFFVGSEQLIHHTEDADGRLRLVLRALEDGSVVDRLTSGKHKDKHPSPFVPARGPTKIAFSSKKRGIEIPGQTDVNYDVFVGILEGVRVKR